MTSNSDIYRFGDFTLYADKRQLLQGEREIPLQPKVFNVLHYLVQHAGRVVPKDELLETVWSGTVVTDDVLTRVISVLRRALGDRPRSSHFIRAIPRVGYRFIAEVHRGEAKATAVARLAVLPFLSMVDGERDESLELGMADTLIARLSSLPCLVVLPFDTVREFASSVGDAHEIAARLQVEHWLEGSLQRCGDRVRITTRLVATADETALWAETFDERFSDIFGLQDRICEHICRELAPRLGNAGRVRTPRTTGAYRAYLEGRLFFGRYTPPDVEQALRRFEMAVDEDPTYASAWAGIAECHDFLGTLGENAASHYNAAGRASRRALALDPADPEAQCMFAKIAWQFDWDWQTAERVFEEAIARYPYRADLHIAYSDFCCYLRHPLKSIEQARAALLIDPVSPWVNTLLAQALYMAGDYNDALLQIEHTLELAPGFPHAVFFAGLIRFASGEHDQGIAHVEIALESGRQDYIAALGLFCGLTDRREQATAILAQLEARGAGVPPFAPAVVHLGLGNVAQAVAGFERCIEQRSWHILLIYSDPTVSAAACAPEFRRLLSVLDLQP